MKIIKPKAGQKSVWDYPRPPRLEPFPGHIRIVLNAEVILDTTSAFRILETSHPPTYYLPPSDFEPDVLRSVQGSSYCEFKGHAAYYDLHSRGRVVQKAAWYYPNPNKIYAEIKDYVSVYAHLMDACYVNDEKVKAQESCLIKTLFYF